LDGVIPTENLRFREHALTFKLAETAEDDALLGQGNIFDYPAMEKTNGGFHLKVEKGQYTNPEIIVLLGENGTGKTTFLRLLAGLTAADDGTEIPKVNMSYKPQKISPKFPVSHLLSGRLPKLISLGYRSYVVHEEDSRFLDTSTVPDRCRKAFERRANS